MKRHEFPAFLVFLLGVLAVSLLLGSSTIARAESGNQSPEKRTEKEREFSSFVDYRIKPAHFQNSFREIIEFIAAGSTQPPKVQSLQRALSMLAAREKAESRGRLDIVYFLQGYANEKLGKTKVALQAYGRAVRERPQNPLYVFRHAAVLMQENRCAEAVHEFEQIAWTVKQASYEPLFLAGECLEKLGRTDEAKRMFAEAIKRNPHYAPAQKKLILQYKDALSKEFDPKKRGEIETQIRTAFDTIVQQNPEDRDAALEYAELLLEGRNAVLTAANSSRAASLALPFAEKSSYHDERAVRLLFDAQRRLGKGDEAAETLKRGLENAPASESLLAAKRDFSLERQLQEPSENSR